MFPEDEARLIEQAVHQPAALRALYRHYHPRIFAYVACRVGREQDAEDIVSDVFIRMMKALRDFRYRGEGSFAAWLFRIARNEVNRFHARRRDQGQVSIHDLPDIASDLLPPDQIFMQKEQFLTLRSRIAALSPRRQDIVTLKFFGDLRNRDIAHILGLDERTIASHLHRALNDLRRAYRVEAEGDHHAT